MTEAPIQSFFDPDTFTVTHLVSDPVTRRAAIIDCVLDYDPKSGCASRASADRIIEQVSREGLTLDWLLEDHAHADHLSAAPCLKQKLGAQIATGCYIREVQAVFKRIFNAKDMNTEGGEFDHLFDGGERFKIDELEVRVMHTPGHTPACLTFIVGQDAFSGDTLFMPDYGVIEAEFVAMRSARDRALAMPTLMLPAVQLKLRAGQLSASQDNGVSYVKIPINVI